MDKNTGTAPNRRTRNAICNAVNAEGDNLWPFRNPDHHDFIRTRSLQRDSSDDGVLDDTDDRDATDDAGALSFKGSRWWDEFYDSDSDSYFDHYKAVEDAGNSSAKTQDAGADVKAGEESLPGPSSTTQNIQQIHGMGRGYEESTPCDGFANNSPTFGFSRGLAFSSGSDVAPEDPGAAKTTCGEIAQPTEEKEDTYNTRPSGKRTMKRKHYEDTDKEGSGDGKRSRSLSF